MTENNELRQYVPCLWGRFDAPKQLPRTTQTALIERCFSRECHPMDGRCKLRSTTGRSGHERETRYAAWYDIWWFGAKEATITLCIFRTNILILTGIYMMTSLRHGDGHIGQLAGQSLFQVMACRLSKFEWNYKLILQGKYIWTSRPYMTARSRCYDKNRLSDKSYT